MNMQIDFRGTPLENIRQSRSPGPEVLRFFTSFRHIIDSGLDWELSRPIAWDLLEKDRYKEGEDALAIWKLPLPRAVSALNAENSVEPAELHLIKHPIGALSTAGFEQVYLAPQFCVGRELELCDKGSLGLNGYNPIFGDSQSLHWLRFKSPFEGENKEPGRDVVICSFVRSNDHGVTSLHLLAATFETPSADSPDRIATAQSAKFELAWAARHLQIMQIEYEQGGGSGPSKGQHQGV